MASEDQKLRSASVRQAILDTALEIGIQEGFEALSIRKIIGRMRYSTGVVYHYFKDKQEIINAVEAAETDRLRAQIMEALDDTQGIIHNMASVFHRIMRLAFEEPETYNLIVLHKYSRQTTGRPPWLGYISEGLKKGMADGAIRDMDADKAAFAVWSSFLGFNLMISRHGGWDFSEAEDLFRTQLTIILKGVLPYEPGERSVRDHDEAF